MTEHMAQKMDDQIEGSLCENERLQAELTRLRAEVARLEAEKAEADANQIAALDLVSRIRFALGDNGKRMQGELIVYCAEAVKDAERYRHLSNLRVGAWIGEDGKEYPSLSAAIDTAMRGDREDG